MFYEICPVFYLKLCKICHLFQKRQLNDMQNNLILLLLLLKSGSAVRNLSFYRIFIYNKKLYENDI